ncbi:hypothetical protein LNV09_13510 [Paucibacter sp. B2R-40]|uniref:hypothetical protein n=1 Tax=Paucibacter sp. B2R-40 TaxID=2893554 RepID=UPI0021E4BF46|nr:hypothetical protein [Paucibacter sp. B2R-40]MCV2355167.1 hypothetical protein [Paucibacter sp. B2R-40]
MHSCSVFVVLLSAAVAGAAAAVLDDRAELRTLDEQRAVIEAQFKADSELCARRFFVNACLDDAKLRRSAGLKPLQDREAVLDANERRARAEAQRERVAAREREFAQAQGRLRTAELLAPAPAHVPPASKAQAAPAPKPSSESQLSTQRAKAAQASEAAQRRQVQKADYLSEQVARQKAAERRQVLRDEKLKGKKQPTALPIPSAADIEAAASAPPLLKR